MSGFVVPPEVSAIQARATDPEASAWVSANAGAGKTHVLTERVVRLMAAGTRPEAILCLTYTTAAAAEMKARVFARLAGLALADDATVDGFLGPCPAGTDPGERRRATRRLFASALEAPGGLRIQTIHAFCAALLRQFPLEANVSGRFRVLDDAARDELRAGAIEAVLAEAARAPRGEAARALERLLAHVPPTRAVPALEGAVAQRGRLVPWLQLLPDTDPATTEPAIAEILGLEPGETRAAIEAAIVASPHFDADRIAVLIETCAGGGKTDADLATRLAAFRAEKSAEAWLAVFRLADGSTFRKPSGLATKAVKARLPFLEEAAAAEIARLEALVERRAAAMTAEASAALFALADRAIAAMDREKARAGLIDYDDQIARAADLLATREAAEWVRHKLDQGIDHILVDEAQDTSPAQWRIVGRLAEEFFAGETARAERRTLFVVGDGKQSIYSFQGADPAGFDRERAAYRKQAAAAGAPFHDVALRHSFRSAPTVLAAVDAVFADPDRGRAVLAGEGGTHHEAIRAAADGAVEIWPVTEDHEPEIPDDWTLPLDHEKRRSSAAALAERIAGTVRGWLDDGLVLSDGRRMTAGDVLVLVRRRAGFADLMNKAFKAAGIPVAGADRLDVVAEIAVEDLAALARAALTPADDLSLAAVLKSPLVGLPEEDLFDLAHDRQGTLRGALLARRGEPAFADAATRVERWVRRAAGARPFDFFAEVLGPEGGRRRFLSRLGSEVAEVLDAFLGMALDHEGSAVPTLESFLRRLSLSTAELKREMETGADAARVMTVHGAKGLEARLVFLVDHCGAPVAPGHLPSFLDVPAGGDVAGLVWSPGRAHRPPAVQARLDERARAAQEEYLRLLYVGITRARDRLVVCGYRKKREPHPACWHGVVSDALVPRAAEIRDAKGSVAAWRIGPAPAFAGPTRSHGTAAAARPAEERASPADGHGEAEPAWLRRPADPPRPTTPVISASDGLGGARVGGPSPPPADDAAPDPAAHQPAVERGDLVHLLLEHLPARPPAARGSDARRLLAERRPDLPAAVARALVDEALAALADPDVAALVSADALVEREILGDVRLPDGTIRRVAGRIDRLVTLPDRLVVLDVKSDRRPPEAAAEVPAVYLEQLALYRALVLPLAGGRPVSAALLYTAGPRLVSVDAALPGGILPAA